MGEDSVKVQREINNLKIKTLEIAIEEDRALERQKKSELEIIINQRYKETLANHELRGWTTRLLKVINS